MASGDRDGPDGAGGVALEVSIGRLPHTGSQLFGWERELEWLDRCWEGGSSAVSIVAWGGVGKSALVNAWLRGMQRDGWRGAERVYGWSFYSQGTTDRISWCGSWGRRTRGCASSRAGSAILRALSAASP